MSQSPPRRQRANTSFFSRRKDKEPQPTPPPPLPILIATLSQPSQSTAPNLAYARALAAALATYSPLPPAEQLLPILTTYCSSTAPSALQVAGFDILSAYWENGEAESLRTSDRLIYFSLFLGSPKWSRELWEPRFKALRAVTKFGTELVGNEVAFLGLLKGWIEGAFEEDGAERERSIGILAAFLTSIADKPAIAARVPKAELASLVQFYATLVDRYAVGSPPPPPTPTHRRHPSSLSTVPSSPNPKSSGDIAVSLYLTHLTPQLRTLPPSSLTDVLPVLFRALASTLTPLPRLALPKSTTSSPSSDLVETLSALLTGPYSSSALLILKKHLTPPSSFLTSLGAHRTLRLHIRRALTARLARAYISRQASLSYSHSGMPTSLDNMTGDLMERAYSSNMSWDAAKLGSALSNSVVAWIDVDGAESILGQVAETLKDILQELDERDDDAPSLDYEEGVAVGQTLYNLASYILQFPYVLVRTNTSPTDSGVSTFTSSYAALHPPLSSTLLLISAHLPDATTALLPPHLPLTPTFPEWLSTWQDLLRNSAMHRPATAARVMEALWSVYESVRDMDTYRRDLADVVHTYTVEHSDDAHDVLWRILGDEIVLREGADDLLELLVSVASQPSVEATSPSRSPSPTVSRSASTTRDVMGILSSFRGPPVSSQTQPLPPVTEPPPPPSLGAVHALLRTFTQLAFLPSPIMSPLTLKIFSILITLLTTPTSHTLTRLAILSVLMRLRADRDHCVFLGTGSDGEKAQIHALAAIIGRVKGTPSDAASELRRARDRGRKPREVPLWYDQEEAEDERGLIVDTVSATLITYDPEGPDRVPVLPVSVYLSALCSLLSEWELASYVLVHLPSQLTNKHFWCGPIARAGITRLVTELCSSRSFPHPNGHQLVYPLLTVLLSYRRSLLLPSPTNLPNAVISTLLAGLDTAPRLALAALSLAAFELPTALTKYLPSILEKLSQIMSSPAMAPHILAFLNIVGDAAEVVARNLREEEWRMVFGVALQYLQHHRQRQGLRFDMAQHVRILSFGTVYVWFLALKLPARPAHVPYITRQLLLAGRIDDATEVCFDWLARYTRDEEKTWLLPNSVLTIRTLPAPKAGWMEVLNRRPSGYTRFLCRLENAPMVGPGDVDPDLESVVGVLVQGRVDVHIQRDEEEEARPDPITGYVWSRTAPSQRRKDVSVDPAFLPLQLGLPPPLLVHSGGSGADPVLTRFLATLDRLPVIDTHKVGVLYVAPAQTTETEILLNTHGSPAYTRFLSGLGRLIDLRGQMDVYAGGLDPTEDGEYAYAWWDDIGQILFHVATMMPSPRTADVSETVNRKKRHVGNDYVRIVWNDSGRPYSFDTLRTQFQFVNIVIAPHSPSPSPGGSRYTPAPSTSPHENAYFHVTLQRARGMLGFSPLCAEETNGLVTYIPPPVGRLVTWTAAPYATITLLSGSTMPMIRFDSMAPDVMQAMCTPMHLILSSDLPTSSGALYCGSMAAVYETETLRAHKINHLVQVLDQSWQPLPENSGFQVYKVNILDERSVDLKPYLEAVCTHIDGLLRSGQNVLVYCQQGVSRSATIVIAYLIRKRGMTYDSAFALVHARRACVKPNDGFVKALKEWDSMSDHRLLTAGVVMAVIGAILVAVIVLATVRFRRKQAASSAWDDGGRRATVVDHGHLASRITPYASRELNPGGDEPRFVHTPGKDMRIATRGPDGAWVFSAPMKDFSPNGIGDLTPSPTTPTHHHWARPSISSTAKLSTKGGFSKKAGFESEYEFEPHPDVLPPPAYAYGYESPGYTSPHV
ncbi:hypothetical protein BDZ89DRAFT_1127780 [Hymenopellis radicata]|nr:hypothetical protein BDZ89DRAFT_1127780 [Hymenopellis radicata]